MFLRSLAVLATVGCFATAFALLALGGFAHADALAPTAPLATWSPGPLYAASEPYILAILQTVVLPAVGLWVAYIMRAKFKLDVSQATQATLQQAAYNAAGRIMAAGEPHIAKVQIPVNSPLIARELPAVQAAVGDAIKHFGLTPDAVAGLIQAKVGQLQATAQASAPTPAPAVTGKPLVALTPVAADVAAAGLENRSISATQGQAAFAYAAGKDPR